MRFLKTPTWKQIVKNSCEKLFLQKLRNFNKFVEDTIWIQIVWSMKRELEPLTVYADGTQGNMTPS